MKRVVIGALLLALASPALAHDVNLDCPASVYFSPKGGATAAIVSEIGQAQREILVLAYSFTSGPIIQALKDARARGVAVRVVLDKGQDSPRYADLRAGLPVLFDRRHAIQHNKTMAIDGRVVILGSFNFTAGAEGRNAENLLITRGCADLVRTYTADWQRHQAHAVKPGQGRVKAVIGGSR